MISSVLRLDPEGVQAIPGSHGQVYGECVARRRWYRSNLSADIQAVAQRLDAAEHGVVADVSAGTGIASEMLLMELRRRRKRIHKLVLADIDYTLARSYMDFAMATIYGHYDDVVEHTEFYILPASDEGFATIADVPGLKQNVDCVMFENAIHVIPDNQKRRTLQGIADCMRRDAMMVMGSGSIVSAGCTDTLCVDRMFDEVRQRVLELCRTCDRYASLAELVGSVDRADTRRLQLLRERVFPPNPTLDTIMCHLRSVGLEASVYTSVTALDRDDYRPFVIEIDTLVDAAILPECSASALRRRHTRTAHADDDALIALRKEIVARAYDEVCDDRGEGLKMLWTGIEARLYPTA